MRFFRSQSFSKSGVVNALFRAARLYLFRGSIHIWQQAGRYIYLRLAGKAPPLLVSIAPSYRCQSKCGHCYAMVKGRDSTDEMPTEKWKAIIDQSKMIGALQIIFTGGEPLLRKDIFDLVAHARRIGLFTRITTNGSLLTRKVVAKLKQAGLNQCGVSIDSADADTHDRLRGLPGAFERAIQGLRLLRLYNIDSKLMTYATHENITGELERIIDLGRKLQVRSVYIMIPVAAGRWANSPHVVLSEAEMARLRKLQDYTFVHLEFPSTTTMCRAYNKAFVYVNTMGEVTPCPAVPYVIGNLQYESFTDIWRRHVSALRLESRGECPMNEDRARKALREHAASVLACETVDSYGRRADSRG